MTTMEGMASRIVAVGLDPGSRYVGLVIRHGDDVVTARVLDRDRLTQPGDFTDPRSWAERVDGYLIEDLAAAAGLAEPGAFVALGVENVTKPHPFGGRADAKARLTDPGPIIDTALVVGILIGRHPHACLVPPRGNGKGHEAAYPRLIGKGARLGGPSDHARAAYDVAGYALNDARRTALALATRRTHA